MKQIRFFLLITAMGIMITGFVSAQTGLSFRQEGIASWYGPGFSGRPTASGEIFDPSQFTAAHPSLPFGTVLTVTNTYNNRQVRVKINDRGPFVAARIIDLSEAAAASLDMMVTGTAHVVIETSQILAIGPVPPSEYVSPVRPVTPVTGEFQPPVSSSALPPSYAPVVEIPPAAYTAPPQTAQPVPQAYNAPQVTVQPQAVVPQAYVQQPEYVQALPPAYMPPSQPVRTDPAIILGGMPPLGTGKLYRLQVGAYRVPRNAVEVFDKLKSAGLNPAYERGDDIYRVVLAGLRPEELQYVTETLGAAGFREVILREER